MLATRVKPRCAQLHVNNIDAVELAQRSRIIAHPDHTYTSLFPIKNKTMTDQLNRKTISPRWLYIIAGFLLPAMVVFYTSIGLDRSAFVMMTTPDYIAVDRDVDISRNSLIGYSGAINDRITQRENIPFYNHVAMFLGGSIATDFYALRPVYSFVVSTMTLPGKVSIAFLLVNCLSWWAGVVLIFCLGKKVLGSNTAGMFAALFSIFSIGFAAHIHDHSAHIMAFPVFFAALLLVYSSDIWRRPRSIETHITIGLLLTLASLQYNTGLIATLGYFICAIRYNGLLKPLGTVLVVFTIKSSWPEYMNLLSGRDIDYGLTEQLYRQRALNTLIESKNDLRLALKNYLGGFIGYIFVTAPHITILGVIGLSRFLNKQKNHDLTIFFAAFYLLPLVALPFYIGFDLAKGYISFQLSAAIFIGCAYLCCQLRRYTFLTTNWGVLIALICVVLQGLWSYSYVFGFSLPVKTYFLGVNQLYDAVANNWAKPTALSFTDGTNGPFVIGGNKRLDEFGFSCPNSMRIHTMKGHGWQALALRLPFAILICLNIYYLLFRKTSRKNQHLVARIAALTVLFLFLAPFPILANIHTKQPIASACVLPQTKMRAGTNLTYEIEISPNFLRALETYDQSTNFVELHHGFFDLQPTPNSMIIGEIWIGGAKFEVSKDKIQRLNFASVIEGLKRNPKIIFQSIQQRHPYQIYGWQANTLTGRQLSINTPKSTSDYVPILPSIELRVRRNSPNSPLLLIGF